MKIKISITKTSPTKSKDVLKKDIVDKLNSIVTAKDFFSWEDDLLRVKSCSNVSLHNKLIILLSLFTDSNYRGEFETYTSFNSLGYIGFSNYEKLESLVALDKFVDSIKYLDEIQIEVTNL